MLTKRSPSPSSTSSTSTQSSMATYLTEQQHRPPQYPQSQQQIHSQPLTPHRPEVLTLMQFNCNSLPNSRPVANYSGGGRIAFIVHNSGLFNYMSWQPIVDKPADFIASEGRTYKNKKGRLTTTALTAITIQACDGINLARPCPRGTRPIKSF
ncbi:hypothetical protein FF38_04056 [Lucilia cuprina]|uniref:Uncharacterized protein n=1 Tax=Lucilia cuprina TaxID=7375 RepID=A0A0L0CHS9_LUCCU|nr:hypothetical protein FF38_04056 [Lucilia cuprina]